MPASDLALVRGLADTRATLDGWNAQPWPVLRRWLGCSLAITGLLLVAVWVVATRSLPDPAGLPFPGLRGDPMLADVGRVLFRNGLVLAAARDGVRRRLHRRQLAAAGGPAPRRPVACGA